MLSTYVISSPVWFLHDEPPIDNSGSKILKTYLQDAYSVFEKESAILSDINLIFTSDKEKLLRTMFESLLYARKLYQEEHAETKVNFSEDQSIFP